jgi:hypothetical protein
MKEENLERLILGYEAGVQHPEVSGIEHLNLLQVRSKLAELEPQLTETQRQRLKRADQVLVMRAGEFLCAIQSIADLVSWRAQEGISPVHWWWYLDVIAHLPTSVTQMVEQGQPLDVVPA